jgi:amidase
VPATKPIAAQSQSAQSQGGGTNVRFWFAQKFRLHKGPPARSVRERTDMAHATEDVIAIYARSDGLDLGKLVRRGEVSPGELIEAAVTIIERLNPRLNAVVHTLYDMARSAAPAVDRNAPFAGVPYLLKESGTMWEGAPLTSASAWMRNVVASTDAEVVRRVKAAGFLLVGKSNAPENGWCLSTEPRLYGPTRNPWRDGVTPGGSSGGSAAAVAAGMVPIAEASDGAGSIRVPASCCGIVGLKPSRGRITASPAGDSWYGCSYDLCVSRTVRDTAAYLDAVAGVLPGDPYQAPRPDGRWLDVTARPPGRLRIGFSVVPPDGNPVGVEPATAVRRTISVLERLGNYVEEHDLPSSLAEIWPIYTRMTAVHTARGFEARAPLVGAPVTQNDVEPLTWAVIQRGRSVSGPSGEPGHLRRPRAIRHLCDADPDAAATTARLSRHGRAGSRPLQCEMDGRSIHVSVQHFRPARHFAAIALVARRSADRRATGRPPWRRGEHSQPCARAGTGDALAGPKASGVSAMATAAARTPGLL